MKFECIPNEVPEWEERTTCMWYANKETKWNGMEWNILNGNKWTESTEERKKTFGIFKCKCFKLSVKSFLTFFLHALAHLNYFLRFKWPLKPFGNHNLWKSLLYWIDALKMVDLMQLFPCSTIENGAVAVYVVFFFTSCSVLVNFAELNAKPGCFFFVYLNVEREAREKKARNCHATQSADTRVYNPVCVCSKYFFYFSELHQNENS